VDTAELGIQAAAAVVEDILGLGTPRFGLGFDQDSCFHSAHILMVAAKSGSEEDILQAAMSAAQHRMQLDQELPGHKLVALPVDTPAELGIQAAAAVEDILELGTPRFGLGFDQDSCFHSAHILMVAAKSGSEEDILQAAMSAAGAAQHRRLLDQELPGVAGHKLVVLPTLGMAARHHVLEMHADWKLRLHTTSA
jgi:methanogenic corrinoid protein MtbC1